MKNTLAEIMTAKEVVDKIREQDKKGQFVLSDTGAMGLVYSFRAEEKEKEDAGQGQLW
jgi:hypothetical protein